MNITKEGKCFTEYAIGQKVQLQSRRGTEHNDLEPTPLMQGGRTNMHRSMYTGAGYTYGCQWASGLGYWAARAISMADTGILPQGAVHTCAWRYGYRRRGPGYQLQWRMAGDGALTGVSLRSMYVWQDHGRFLVRSGGSVTWVGSHRVVIGG